MDLFTSLNNPIEGKFLLHSTLEMKNFLRNNNNKTHLTVSNNPDEGQYTNLGEALDAVTDGGSIYIKKGIYSLNYKSIADKSIVIIGENADETIITGTTGAMRFVTLSNGKRIIIRNLRFEDSSVQAILIENGSTPRGELIVDGCIFYNNYRTFNIRLDKGIFINNKFLDTGDLNILISASNGSYIISNNIFENITLQGVYIISPTKSVIVTNNIFLNQGNWSLFGPASNIVVSNNLIVCDPNTSHTRGGISVASSSNGNCVITNNSISMDQNYTSYVNNWNAISIYEAGKGVIISNNTINIVLKTPNGGNTRDAISLVNADEATVNGNSIKFKLTRASGSTEGTGLNILGSARNSINNNEVEMDDHADDIAITLIADSDYNRISALFAYKVGRFSFDTCIGNLFSNSRWRI